MPAMQSNCAFTNVSNINVSNQWQNLGCRFVLLLYFTISKVAKKSTLRSCSYVPVPPYISLPIYNPISIPNISQPRIYTPCPPPPNLGL